MSDNTPATQKPEAAKPARVNILKDIQGQVDSATRRGLAFPSDFNLANAMASARTALITLGVIDINGTPTNTCSVASLVNAVYDMAVQGMNVGKKQGYFINYGGVLTFQRSYFGDIALAERVVPNLHVYGDVILQNEKFVPKRVHSKRGLITVVEIHEMAWPNRDMKTITGCYIGANLINPETGESEDLGIELMTIEQIKTSWKKSKTYKPAGGTFHTEQPDQACLRTVSRRWSKFIINSSNDSMLLEAITRQDLVSAEAEVTEDAALNANGETLSLPPSDQQEQTVPPTDLPDPKADEETGEVVEDEPNF